MKKKLKVKKITPKRKYANGTGYQGVVNYLETPSGELAKNEIAKAKALEEGANNPWVIGLNTASQLVQQYGAAALGAIPQDEPPAMTAGDAASGALGTTGGMTANMGGASQVGTLAGKAGGGMANGGTVQKVPVEVENMEIGELPNGGMVQFKGNTHENGGINLDLPEGTDIFSERIKIKGVSMAERKKNREKQEKKIEMKLSENPTDRILQETFKKIKEDNALVEHNDKLIQQTIDTLQKGVRGEFAFGTGPLGLDENDPVDPTNPEVDPTSMNFSGEKNNGTSMMPDKFQGKYVHYAPTTVMNEEDAYHRTFGDLLKNMFTTEKGRQNRVMQGKDALVTVEFANGGKVPTYPNGTGEEGVEPETPTTEEVIEGSERHKELLALEEKKKQWQAQQDYFASSGVNPTAVDRDTFISQYPNLAGEDYAPEGSVLYNFGSTLPPDDFSSAPGFVPFTSGPTNEQFLTGTADPGDIPEYTLVDSPEERERKWLLEEWKKENEGIQGYYQNVYSEQVDTDNGTEWVNKTEWLPLEAGQEVPTNKPFRPIGEQPPEGWMPKGTPSFMWGGKTKKANGGKVYAANGATLGGIPDPKSLNDFLQVLNNASNLGTDLQDMMSLNYSDAPISGVDINPYLQEDNSLMSEISQNEDGPFSNLNQGEFPGKWDEYLKWANLMDQGIDPTKINADGTYGDTGLKLMEETPEGEFKLNPEIETEESRILKSDPNAKNNPVSSFIQTMQGMNINPGDLIGLAGNAVSTFGPLLNTLRNRATDTPNENFFKDFGKEGLEKIKKSQEFADDVRAENLKSLGLKSAAQRNRNRNSARSINTMRALDLATEAQANQTEAQIHTNFAQLMGNLLANEAQALNLQDQVVMGGEQARDLADRQDKDTFATNLGRDIATIGTGLQHTGKDINTIKQQEVMLNLLNQLSKYGITVDNTGNLGVNNG
jgi:hypothetical protein